MVALLEIKAKEWLPIVGKEGHTNDIKLILEQGTELNLSLSYDIIKVHGGDLKVETKEGEGSEFIVQLPLKETFFTT